MLEPVGSNSTFPCSRGSYLVSSWCQVPPVLVFTHRSIIRVDNIHMHGFLCVCRHGHVPGTVQMFLFLITTIEERVIFGGVLFTPIPIDVHCRKFIDSFHEMIERNDLRNTRRWEQSLELISSNCTTGVQIDISSGPCSQGLEPRRVLSGVCSRFFRGWGAATRGFASGASRHGSQTPPCPPPRNIQPALFPQPTAPNWTAPDGERVEIKFLQPGKGRPSQKHLRHR